MLFSFQNSVSTFLSSKSGHRLANAVLQSLLSISNTKDLLSSWKVLSMKLLKPNAQPQATANLDKHWYLANKPLWTSSLQQRMQWFIFSIENYSTLLSILFWSLRIKLFSWRSRSPLKNVSIPKSKQTSTKWIISLQKINLALTKFL